ncbi:MAG: hypothetical protein M0011_05850 [Elusimicrobia bacterium]|nr:hypothetical protein [Elusimicrobiota bacterium]
MKTLVWVAIFISTHIVFAGAQPNIDSSTVPATRQGLSTSVQGVDETGYISASEFEQILNDAENTFKKAKPGGGNKFIDITVGMISKKVRENIKFSDYVRTHPDQAIRILDKEIELNGNNIDARNWRATAYREKCAGFNAKWGVNPEKKVFCENALKDFGKVAELSTKDTMGPGYTPLKSEAYRQQGMLYEKMGEQEKALTAYATGLQFVKPGFGNFLYHNRSSLLIEMGKYEEAVTDLKSFLNAHVEKYSKKVLAFSPCKHLFEKGYFVDGCPDKEILQKNDYHSYNKLVSEEMRKHDEEMKKQREGK